MTVPFFVLHFVAQFYDLQELFRTGGQIPDTAYVFMVITCVCMCVCVCVCARMHMHVCVCVHMRLVSYRIFCLREGVKGFRLLT